MLDIHHSSTDSSNQTSASHVHADPSTTSSTATSWLQRAITSALHDFDAWVGTLGRILLPSDSTAKLRLTFVVADAMHFAESLAACRPMPTARSVPPLA